MGATASDFQLQEKCAVFGLYGQTDDAARIAYYGLWALQHRGQESSGIVSSDGTKMYRHAAAGLVANVYRDEDIEKLQGHIAIGHNRYATSGGGSDFYNQPFLNAQHTFSLAHNGNMPDTTRLEKFLEKRGFIVDAFNDSKMMTEAINCIMQEDQISLEKAIIKAYPLFTGVFSVVVMSNDKLIAFRDECGIRPLSIGKLGESHVVASETCAFDTIGATFVRDVEPGEVVVIDENGVTSHQAVKGDLKIDLFEFVYFARPDSVIHGQRINEVRQRFGHEMAKEFPIEADVVIPVPDSGIPTALGYANATGIPFDMGLMKNRYIHRTFIQPTAELRRRSVKMKLNPVIESIKDKRVLLFDDSIVRGTTMKQVVQMIRDTGAKEVHLMISSPPVKFPDFYGINTPSQDELIASFMTNAEMCKELGADSINFLSLEGTMRATGIPAENLSTSCFDGVYPISIGKRARDVAGIQTSGPDVFNQPAKLPSQSPYRTPEHIHTSTSKPALV